MEKVKSLAERLETETDQRRPRAFLAALLASLYQLPIKSVLALSATDLAMNSEEIALWPETHRIRVEGRLAELIRRWTPESMTSGLLFPRRGGVQPFSYNAIRYQLQNRTRQL